MEIFFVLTRPIIPENVGACARALGTMGFQNLRLVAPCAHLQDRARWMATHSSDILERAVVYSTLAEALADVSFVIGCTARIRRQRLGRLTPGEARRLLEEKKESVASAAVVFGPEDSGLDNQELSRCDVVSHIPSSSRHSVLSLAQAVMIYAWELSPLRFPVFRKDVKTRIDSSSHQALKQKLEDLLRILEITPADSSYRRLMEYLSRFGDSEIRFSHFLLERLLDRFRRFSPKSSLGAAGKLVPTTQGTDRVTDDTDSAADTD